MKNRNLFSWKVLLFAGLLYMLFAGVFARAQPTGNCSNVTSSTTPRSCADSQTTSTSATVLTIQNNGGLVPTFEELITGSPATVSIVIKGCSPGGTCDTLDTYTTVANSVRAPAVTKFYSYYTVTPSWTGGTNPTVTVNTTITSARLAPLAGLSGTSPIVVSGGNVSCPTCGTSTGTVMSFAAPSGGWPTWLVPTVTNSTTTPSLAVAAGQIPIGAVGSAGLSGTSPIAVASTGAVSCANATSSAIGCAEADGSSITAANGVFSTPTLGAGLLVLCMADNGVATTELTCLGDAPAVLTGTTSTVTGSSATQPFLLKATSDATSAHSAGWAGGRIFNTQQNPLVKTVTAYTATGDYTSNSRIQIGLMGSACSQATLIASDTPACSYVMIWRSTVRSDSDYQCQTDNGSGSPTVTDITGSAPSSVNPVAMSVSLLGNATSAVCKVGSVSVTVSSTLPASGGQFLWFQGNTFPGGGVTHIFTMGWQGFAQNGTF